MNNKTRFVNDNIPREKSGISFLEKFGKNLTKVAKEGKLDPVIGREKEIKRIIQILSRRRKNNPLLIGEAGVGKTAIAEGLALRIIERKVPRIILDKKVFTLDVSILVAGTKFRGEFEERMQILLKEIQKDKDLILFIDEIHTLVGAGGGGNSLDASNMFKPALARGELQCIGATTLNECRENIEKDAALMRRFQKVIVNPTNIEDTITILHGIKDKYEDHHRVIYTEEAITSCVELADKYITDRFFPDKAIDIMDESGSNINMNNMKVPKGILDLEKRIKRLRGVKEKAIKEQQYERAAEYRDKELDEMNKLLYAQDRWKEKTNSHRETVTEKSIEEVVSDISGIPVHRIDKDESKRLKNVTYNAKKQSSRSR